MSRQSAAPESEAVAFSLLHELANSCGGDELHHVLSLLSATQWATVRLVSRDCCLAASADSLWSPLLSALGFTPEGLSLWADGGGGGMRRPFHELYGRIHRREACEIDLLRRSHRFDAEIGNRRWWAEGALDLLNPYDCPVWLLFSAAVDDIDYAEGHYLGGDEDDGLTSAGPVAEAASSGVASRLAAARAAASAVSKAASRQPRRPAYLQPTAAALSSSTPRGAGRAGAAAAAAVAAANAGRVSLCTASGPPICRGYSASKGKGASELVLLRLDVQRDDVSFDELPVDGLAGLAIEGAASAAQEEAGAAAAAAAATNPAGGNGEVATDVNVGNGASGAAARALERISWLAVDAVQLPARLSRFGSSSSSGGGGGGGSGRGRGSGALHDARDDDKEEEEVDRSSDSDGGSEDEIERCASPGSNEPSFKTRAHPRTRSAANVPALAGANGVWGRRSPLEASRRRDASPAELTARSISIGKHLFACAPPSVSGMMRPFAVDVALVCSLTAMSTDGQREVPIDESVDLGSHHGAKVPTTLPQGKPAYVVNASSTAQGPSPFFGWERRARFADAIAGRGAFEPRRAAEPTGGEQSKGHGVAEGPSRWCRQAADPNLLQLEVPRTTELRMTLLRSTRVVASVAPASIN